MLKKLYSGEDIIAKGGHHSPNKPGSNSEASRLVQHKVPSRIFNFPGQLA